MSVFRKVSDSSSGWESSDPSLFLGKDRRFVCVVMRGGLSKSYDVVGAFVVVEVFGLY